MEANDVFTLGWTLDEWIKAENAHGRSPDLDKWPNRKEVEEYLKRFPQAQQMGATMEMGRLALREEGDYWQAYYAEQGTMKGAVHLASIRINAVRDNPEIRRDFMELMKAIVANYIEEVTGERVEWPNTEQTAPQHERAGKA